ncbi:hypothetical protein TRAPUB_6478 [Trametes pubescens]|uniref:Glycolipid transfer protein domain-containing protein n=1 Tax=Trametes pubescens TaxID=154538 RepID=A0A1M2V5N1_TRAPU|nr:hypothetical protein TRAPUB_6478 [Trametes pubescens]
MQRDRDAELHTCFRRSYDANLKHHHAWLVRQVVAGGSHAKFDNELTTWLAGLEAIVLRLKAFLAQGSYGEV